jgi:thiamine pyrophosphate-dependent acetolactate synthase large subunit-like protein
MDAWTGGRAVVEMLKVEAVKHVWGIVGSTFLDGLDRLYDDSSVEYINVRHEQAAAFMAAGLARVTDRPGVCLVTSGPGATNLITASPPRTWPTRRWSPWSAGSRSITIRRTSSRSSTFSTCFGRSPSSRDAVKAALAAGAPAIIEIPIDPDEFPTPAAAVRRPD